jgi:spermidine synthase
MDWDTFAMVGRSFSQVFPNSLLLRTNPSSLGPDFLLVGFNSKKRPAQNYLKNNLRHAGQSKNVTLKNHRLFYHLIISEDLQRLFKDGQVNTDARPWLEFSAPKLLHIKDPLIKQHITSNMWLSDDTLSIIRKDLSDIKWQIDYAEFALSIIRPEMAFQNPVDLAMASASERNRFNGVLKTFCESNIITDFSLFGDEEITRVCILTQIKTAQDKLLTNQEKVPLNLHLGVLHSEIGMMDEAHRFFQEALRLDPNNPDVHYDLALFYSRQGRTLDAVKHYSETLLLRPYHQNASNNLAWIFATNENPKIRNGERAVQLAEQSCNINDDDPFLLDTLAAAYAETGRFSEALKVAREAIAMAQLSGYEDLLKDIEKRFSYYQMNRPYRENRT